MRSEAGLAHRRTSAVAFGAGNLIHPGKKRRQPARGGLDVAAADSAVGALDAQRNRGLLDGADGSDESQGQHGGQKNKDNRSHRDDPFICEATGAEGQRRYAGSITKRCHCVYTSLLRFLSQSIAEALRRFAKANRRCYTVSAKEGGAQPDALPPPSPPCD